jgi:adenylate cyclase
VSAPSLASLSRCFQGLLPAAIATCAPDGTPNITFLSQVYYVDPTHVALSCQFFNKTRRNVGQNPHASVEVMDPLTLEAYKLRVRYTHTETAGPLFAAMDLRIQAIASVTGMGGIFKLIGADVYEVLGVERVEGFVSDASNSAAAPEFSLSNILGVQIVSQQINQARDLDQTLEVLLRTLDEVCGFNYSMMLLPDESGRRLVAIASRGYGEPGTEGIGAEVPLGEGFIGTAAEQRRVLRVSNIESELRYGRAIRQRIEAVGEGKTLRPEIALPGLPGAQSHLALPLVVQDRLVGVLALEAGDPLAFGTWDEALLQILANQIAMAIDRHDRDEEEPALAPVAPPARAPGGARRSFTFFRNDDCVFVDGEYLIRNVPGKIFWKLLTAFHRDGRTEFSNRELRLDPSLGLPPVKNNLESRLILLRKRLEQQCPDVRLVPVKRGRFALEVTCPLELLEKDSS